MTTISVPSAAAYRSQCAEGTSSARHNYHAALATISDKARPSLRFPVELALLIDTLAQRVETHSAEARAMFRDQMDFLDTLTPAHAAEFWTRLQTIEGEAARTACLAIGLRVEGIAPCDYPTLTRYWLACRQAFGALV